MHIDEANLSNLTSLWHKYGSQPVKANTPPLLQVNTHWPHRCWIDWNAQSDDVTAQLLWDVNDSGWVKNIPESTVFPLRQTMNANNDMPACKFESQVIEQLLLDKNWYCAFEQTAMCLALPGKAKHKPQPQPQPQLRPGFYVKSVNTLQDSKVWADIGSEAFAYEIDHCVVQQLIHADDVQLLVGWDNHQPIVSGLLYKTGDVIGVHQVGVKPAFQGKGFANSFMLDIIAACEQWQGKYVVLQASQRGKPLYEKLGFKSQFIIKNFKRV